LLAGVLQDATPQEPSNEVVIGERIALFSRALIDPGPNDDDPRNAAAALAARQALKALGVAGD
jgi:hypothetical protein